jgi:predicted anti-sigma-YlaC factor YlaD
VIDTPIRCVEFVELVTEWMEGELDDNVRADIEEHLVVCAPCRAYVTQTRQAIRVIRGPPVDAPSPATREELLRVFRERTRTVASDE